MGAGDPVGLPDGVTAIPMPFEKKMTSLGNFKCACRIRKLIRKEEYDLVSVHTSLAAFFTRLGILFSGRKPWVINTVHGYLFDENTPWKKRIVLLAAEKLHQKPSDCLVVEDAEAGVKAALNGGFLVAGIGPAKDCPNVNYQLLSLSELLAIEGHPA